MRITQRLTHGLFRQQMLVSFTHFRLIDLDKSAHRCRAILVLVRQIKLGRGTFVVWSWCSTPGDTES